ncbi:hypothetical protein V5O48_002663 [Marasmius crinis-equi]|uniref:C2H2-type domain-containing protein n=1 Tax=Marasmius crinis-equi TaxID=585013 RepID=A0ABR3FUZ6_9AGAR
MSPSKVTTSESTGIECTICGSVLARNGDLARHMKTHSKNKNQILHRCPWEGCTFANLQKSNVDTHYRTHTGDKNQCCPDCDFATVDPGSLTRHRKRWHQYVPKSRKARGSSGSQKSNATTSTRTNHRHKPYPRRTISSSPETPPPPVFLESKYTAMALAQLKTEEDHGRESRYFWRLNDGERILRSPSPKVFAPAVDMGRHMQDNAAYTEELDMTQEQGQTFDQFSAIENWDFTVPQDSTSCEATLWLPMASETAGAPSSDQQWSIAPAFSVEAACLPLEQQGSFAGFDATYPCEWTTTSTDNGYSLSTFSSSESLLVMQTDAYLTHSPTSYTDAYSSAPSSASPSGTNSPYYSPSPISSTDDSSFSLSPSSSKDFIFAQPSPQSMYSSSYLQLEAIVSHSSVI